MSTQQDSRHVQEAAPLTKDDNPWSAVATAYHKEASELTTQHASNLVALLAPDIVNAKTILDIGCGTGAFAKAYCHQFPQGIPGQRFICSDLSQGMLDQAQKALAKFVSKTDGGDKESVFATEIVFQIEDGTKLDGIDDDSIDIVVSMFGIFLIPDSIGVQRAIQRVLNPKTGIMASASWQFGVSEKLSSQKDIGAPTLQDAFELPISVLDHEGKGLNGQEAIQAWSTPKKAHQKLIKDYEFSKAATYTAYHTAVCNLQDLWNMVQTNPVSRGLYEAASPELREKAQNAMLAFVSDHLGDDRPVLDMNSLVPMATASVLSIGRK